MVVPYEFAIDVSGTPRGTTYFGIGAFHPYYKNKVLRELYEEFRECNYQKGRQIKHDRLIEIITFLDERKVKMSVLCFPSILWEEYYEKYKREHSFLEKMYAVNYLNLIRSLSRPDNTYTLISCVETQAGSIDRVFHNCRRLGSKIRIDLDCNYAHDKTNRSVKVADIIANAGRKVKSAELEDLNNFRIIPDNRIHQWSQWTSRYLFDLRK